MMLAGMAVAVSVCVAIYWVMRRPR